MAFVEGQKSMFVAQPGFAASTKLADVVGAAKPKAGLHCEAWSTGKWYKAIVREFDAASGQYHVHYLGWDAKYDEWTAGENVRAYRPRQFAVGAKVQAYSDEEAAWYPATVQEAWYGLHLVHYDDYDATWDEWLGPKYVKPR
jgi:hypothetical protein